MNQKMPPEEEVEQPQNPPSTSEKPVEKPADSPEINPSVNFFSRIVGAVQEAGKTAREIGGNNWQTTRDIFTQTTGRMRQGTEALQRYGAEEWQVIRNLLPHIVAAAGTEGADVGADLHILQALPDLTRAYIGEKAAMLRIWGSAAVGGARMWAEGVGTTFKGVTQPVAAAVDAFIHPQILQPVRQAV